jgi:HD-GYP domain-containing protein (c-di-GMP phosphodiesterase class II)
MELYGEQAELMGNMVQALTSAIDAKDPYTCGHSDRVARVSVRLGRELGCDSKTIETLYLSGLLHDVGKIGIDDHVLRKPGRLTDEEFDHIKTHPQLGYNILCGIKQLAPVLPVVLHHHEAWDGSGYPHGQAGEAIPYLARICSVADAYDAMGSDRVYRKGMIDERVDAIIRTGSGRQWDPAVVAAFFRVRDDIRDISRRERDQEVPEMANLFLP